MHKAMGAQQVEFPAQSLETTRGSPQLVQTSSADRRQEGRRLALWLLVLILALSVPVAAAIAFLTELP
jgi:hypothetical protein